MKTGQGLIVIGLVLWSMVYAGYGSENSHESLQAAIEHISQSFGKNYPDGPKYLAALDRIADSSSQAFKDLQREALIANPLVSRHPILFVERRQYPSDHHNTGNLFQAGEVNAKKFEFMAGGALKTVNLANGEVKALIHSDRGMPRDPEVRFDGKEIVFSLRHGPRDDYHIYKIKPDGSDLVQLTFANGVSDTDPFYLSDGGIAFGSTREPKYCACNRHIMRNLFRMESDGANILQIGKSIENEGHGIQMPDGSLLYNRWEYVDRNFGGGQGLWLSNPDGTGHNLYYGQSTPHAMLNARPIPGSNKIICILSSCHDRPWGALTILDRTLGAEGKKPVIQTWPASARDLIAGKESNYADSGGFDVFKKVLPKYEDPFALDEHTFLVSRLVGSDEKMGIYLVDTFGNEFLLHMADSNMGCYDPMPAAPSKTPAVVPARRNYTDKNGYFFVANVYEGTHLKGVKSGSVKSIRVVEGPPKLFWTEGRWDGQGRESPAMNWHDFNNKTILGTVPVSEDGSAYFEVPADRFVFFQMLDDKGKMIQSMRSGVVVQPGELNSCVGCHEDRFNTPKSAISYSSAALKGEPSKLEGWYGAARHFSFLKEVQPVFDKRCVECHDYGKKEGEKLNLAADKTLVFNTAYMELQRKKYVGSIGGGPNAIMEAYSWGSHASKLIKRLDTSHCGENLSAEEYDRIVTWLDLNAPYYPTYASAYDTNPAGRSPLGSQQLERLKELTGKGISLRHGAAPMISFDRPELSPILRGMKELNVKAYGEALAIIRAGQAILKEKPRGDMEGFQASQTDQNRKKKYDRLWTHQLKVRSAIAEGRKIYDKELVD